MELQLPKGMTLNPVSRSRFRVSELRRKKNAAMKALSIKTGKAYRKYIKKKRRIAHEKEFDVKDETGEVVGEASNKQVVPAT